jgi:hypothetical protein
MWLPCSVCGLAVVLVLKARAPSPVVVCHPVGCGRMADRYCCRGRDPSRDSGEAGMGVLTDYFRAPSVAAVLEQMAERDGGPLVSEGSESSAFDGVELKSIDPPVALGRLVAFAMDRDYSSDLVNDRLIWPEGELWRRVVLISPAHSW